MDISLPQSRLPEMVPNFVGRESECENIITSLTSESTRLVNIYGSPGFGKTSTAISIGYRLQSTGQPVYFFTFRGINSKNGFISKLLGFFKRSMTSHLTPEDELCSCIHSISCCFFLILDNLDDILACSTSDNHAATSTRNDVLKIIEEILMHCRNARILTTTRESLRFIDLKMEGNKSVRIEPLDAMSSLTLVNEFLPSVGKKLSLQITQICGNVPLAIKLLCCLISGDKQSPEECLNDFLISSGSIIEKLDNSKYSFDLRIKCLFESSFNRLSLKEQEGLISLSVFEGADFDFDVAVAVVSGGDRFQGKQTLTDLEEKALINYNFKNKVYSLHPLLQSFAVEKGDSALKEVVPLSKRRLYEYYLNLFEILNEQFMTDKATMAFAKYFQQEKSIWLSFYESLKDEKLCAKFFDVIAKAEMFLHALHLQDVLKIESLYEFALNEAQKRRNDTAHCKLFVSKCFFQIFFFNTDGIFVGESKEVDDKIFALRNSTSAKYLCYQGIYALSNGRTEPGIELLEKALRELSNSAEQIILKVLSLQILTVYYNYSNDKTKSTQFSSMLFKEVEKNDYLSFTLVDGLKNESAYESVTAHSPLIVWSIYLLSFWAREYLTPKTKEKLRNIVQKIQKYVGLTLLDCGNALTAIAQIHDLALAFLCQKDGAKVMEDTVERIRIDLEKEKRQREWEDSGPRNTIRRRLLAERLAVCYHSTGRNHLVNKLPSLALQMYQKELEVRLELDEERGPKIADCYRIIGMIQEEMGRFIAALRSHRLALAIRLKLYGLYHRDTAQIYNNIGIVESQMKDHTSCLKSYHCALSIRLKLHGEMHADTADSFNNLGNLQSRMGDHISALQSHQRGLDIRLKLFGKQHKYTAYSYCNIGIVQSRMTDYTSTLESFQHVLEISLNLYGEQHENTADAYSRIASVQKQMGENTSAKQSLLRAIDIRSKLHDEPNYGSKNAHRFSNIVERRL